MESWVERLGLQGPWLVAPGGFEDLAARAASLLADDGARRAMGRCARERATTRLTLDASVARVGALLDRLAAPPGLAGLAVAGGPLHSVRGRPQIAPRL